MRRPGQGVGTRAYDLRLSYVVWAKWLPFDPMLFAMPPETRLEVVHTEDAGRAFAAAAELSPPRAGPSTSAAARSAAHPSGLSGQNIPLLRPWRLLIPAPGGLCGLRLPLRLVRRLGSSRGTAAFQKKNLEDYYEEVRWETRLIAPFATLAAPRSDDGLSGKAPISKAGLNLGQGASKGCFDCRGKKSD
jgi:hypothetical protein